jgi:uncharacterized tellurite resistance protein B-like protein
MSTRNELIADLLMGAAHADKSFDGREYEVVKKLLANVMSVTAIPEEMLQRLEGFDPTGFDPAAAAKSLSLEDDDDKRRLMELVAAVTEADEELDLDEHEYLETVAGALELPRNTYSDLSFEVLSVDNLKAAGEKLIKPPPIPQKAKR